MKVRFDQFLIESVVFRIHHAETSILKGHFRYFHKHLLALEAEIEFIAEIKEDLSSNIDAALTYGTAGEAYFEFVALLREQEKYYSDLLSTYRRLLRDAQHAVNIDFGRIHCPA